MEYNDYEREYLSYVLLVTITKVEEKISDLQRTVNSLTEFLNKINGKEIKK